MDVITLIKVVTYYCNGLFLVLDVLLTILKNFTTATLDFYTYHSICGFTTVKKKG